MQMHSAIDYVRLCCAILLELTMKRIEQYRPPEPADLLALKSELQATSAEMARLAGLTQGQPVAQVHRQRRSPRAGHAYAFLHGGDPDPQ